MNYAIQRGMFQGRHEEMLFNVLERFNFPIFYFKHIPFTEDLIYDDDLKPDDGSNTIVFGSVRVSHFANKYKWTPGSF